mgnify:CR=1 FL=1
MELTSSVWTPVGKSAFSSTPPILENIAEMSQDASGIEGLLDAGYAVTVTAGAQGTLVRLKRAINETGIANFDCIRSRAIDGFVDNAAKVALLTERDLTGRTSAAGQAKTPKRRRKAIDLMELKAGDYVVHEQHGIGRFLEMRQRTIGAGANQTTREYLVIEYASSKRGAPADKLFIPTDQLDQVSKYIGADAPKLNKLGGSDWAATKRKHVSMCTKSPKIWSNCIRHVNVCRGMPSAKTPLGRKNWKTLSRTKKPLIS